jgi:hypothetical protein
MRLLKRLGVRFDLTRNRASQPNKRFECSAADGGRSASSIVIENESDPFFIFSCPPGLLQRRDRSNTTRGGTAETSRNGPF